jgi:signal transduction histidine kinase
VTESAQAKSDVSLEASILDGAIPLESILRTEELYRRPLRPPAYEKENRALVALVSGGPGIDPGNLNHLFEAFYDQASGLGMGLAIRRSIMEAHCGRLWATVNAPRGAVFQFILPVNSG